MTHNTYNGRDELPRGLCHHEQVCVRVRIPLQGHRTSRHDKERDDEIRLIVPLSRDCEALILHPGVNVVSAEQRQEDVGNAGRQNARPHRTMALEDHTEVTSAVVLNSVVTADFSHFFDGQSRIVGQ